MKLRFLVLATIRNPGPRAFLVDGVAPEALQKGDVAQFREHEDTDELSKADEILIKQARALLALPTPENIARVKAEVKAEREAWAKITDPNADGCSRIRGFRNAKA